MKRIKLSERELPNYTHREELFNSISHGLGTAFGIVVLTSCLAVSSYKQNLWEIFSSVVYGASLIVLYTMSCIYHGLPKGTAKKIMQVLDHCTIYYLIAGTYTPIVLCAIRPYSPTAGWAIFAFVWGCAVVGSIFTAIDLKKYAKLSMTCYICMGWCIVLAIKPALACIPLPALLWILMGGISYTFGAILYGLGKKRRYIHCIFHLFVLLGSILQYVGVIGYVL